MKVWYIEFSHHVSTKLGLERDETCFAFQDFFKASSSQKIHHYNMNFNITTKLEHHHTISTSPQNSHFGMESPIQTTIFTN